MTALDAAKRAAAVLARAEALAENNPDGVHALVSIADSWRYLAQTLDDSPRLCTRETS